MSDEKSAARELLSEFQRLQDQAAAVQGTGDISLDLILAGFGSEHSVWLRQLAIPHWFNESLVSSIVPSASEASGFFSEIAAMPWVRSHPQGLVFHDQIRHRLRQSLLESKSELFREACKKLSSALLHVTENIDPNESRPATDGEIRRERIYLTLAFDESQGFEELQVEISDARKKRLINVTDALVHMAEEQLPLLSAEGKSQVELYRGLLWLDLRAWDEAIDAFAKVDINRLATALRIQAALGHGMALEGCGRWVDAREFYHGLTKCTALSSPGEDVIGWAKIHERQAEVFFAMRDLKRSEKYCKLSLKLNRKAENLRGEAINLRMLGAIFERLHDTAKAEETLMQSLALFQTWGSEEDKAQVWSALGAVSLNAAQWAQARDAYEEEQRIRLSSMDHYGLAFVYANLGKLVMAEAGNVEEALRYLSASIELFQQFRDPMNCARALRNRSLILEIEGRYSEALETMKEAHLLLPENSALKHAYAKEVRRLTHKAK